MRRFGGRLILKQGKKLQLVRVRVPDEMKQLLQLVADVRSESVSVVLREAVRCYFFLRSVRRSFARHPRIQRLLEELEHQEQ